MTALVLKEAVKLIAVAAVAIAAGVLAGRALHAAFGTEVVAASAGASAQPAPSTAPTPAPKTRPRRPVVRTTAMLGRTDGVSQVRVDVRIRNPRTTPLEVGAPALVMTGRKLDAPGRRCPERRAVPAEVAPERAVRGIVCFRLSAAAARRMRSAEVVRLDVAGRRVRLELSS